MRLLDYCAIFPLIAGTVTPEATDLRMTVAGFEEGGAGVDMRVTSERIGDCDDQDA